MDKLMDCPFCGGSSQKVVSNEVTVVRCMSCFATSSPEKWNTRHTPEGWHPIGTAPTGTMILLADMHAREARYWAFVGWRHSGSADGCVTTTERAQQPATHWAPLPAVAPKWGGG